MTPKQKAAMDYWHYDAGVKHGGELAQSIIDEFPEGFDDTQIAKIAADAKLSKENALKAIHKRFRDAFSVGHSVGFNAIISKYREALILRAVRST